ncbi:MAG: zinc metalloprotease HtpX [Deltaproteobacteria bacterium]|nr:zinc metalloprotease HtpX [Deltaproteobacteria bacterium]MCL5792042.1 zinc metalloprotease HtpX [Deltaproteobacteria bacterium]
MNQLKTVVLLGALTGLLIFIGGAIGGQSGMMIAFVIAVVLNFISYWFSDKIVLSLYKAKEVQENDEPRLFSIVRKLTAQDGLPMPKIYIIPTDTPNAFATGRNPEHAAVAVTRGLIGMLNEEELEGVLGHELSHVKHRDILISSISATIAGAIMILARMAMFAEFFGGFNNRNKKGGLLVMLAFAILAPVAATVIQLAISRSREFMADEGSAGLTGNPNGLISALKKISYGNARLPMNSNPSTAHMFIISPFHGKGVLSLFSTHPPVEARIERLEKMMYGR